MNELLWLALGLILGLLVGLAFYLFKKAGLAPLNLLEQAREDLAATRERLRQGEEAKTELVLLQREQARLQAEATRLETELKNERANAINRIAQLEKDRTEIEALVHRFMANEGKRQGQVQEETLQKLLKPFQEHLSEFKTKVETTTLESAKERKELNTYLKVFQEQSLKLGQQTDDLARALKGDSKIQGDWGEVQLDSLLERSGLIKGEQYEVQPAFGGGGQRPDVLVHMPEGREVVIDAKVSLTAFSRYINAGSEEDRARALAEHLKSFREHVKNLSSKAYQDIPALESLDFVLMFVPLEPAYLVALKEDPALFRDAHEKKVTPVSPATLLVVLRTIESLWRIEKQGRNTREIARQAGALYDKFVGFLDSMRDLHKHLERAQEAYDKAFGQLKSGKGDLISRVENLKKLGAKANKEIAPDLLPEPEEEEGQRPLPLGGTP